MQNTTLTHARFPSRGKLLDFFIKALEIENVNDADRKRYQRFVSEENISIEEYNETLNIYIDAILEELVLNKTQTLSAKKAIEDFFELYLSFIQNIEVYAFTQECLNKILVKHIYLPFLTFFNQYYIRVDTNIFSSSNTSTLNDIFNMFKTETYLKDKDFHQYLFNELVNITNESKKDKTLIKSVQNWVDNKVFPTMINIEYLSEIFSNSLVQSKDELKQYFMLAKLIDKSKISKKIIFQGSLNIASEKELEKYIFGCKPQYQNILHLAVDLYNLSGIKKEKTKEMEKQFELVCIQLREKGFTADNMPYIAWSKARYYAQKKEFKEATDYYILALENSKNSMGKHYINIVKEGLLVSAHTTREKKLDLTNAKSSFVKFYKEAYFLKLIDALPDEINQYFLNDIKKQFSLYFTKLYPGINTTNKGVKPHEHGIIYTPDLENIKLDFKKPNKSINNKYRNPMTQLMHSALLVKYDEVKKLIDAGANVNEMRFNDNGTALTMVLSNEFFKEKRKAAIKIAKLLVSKMSEEALCAKLPKKKMTALGLAIDRGYVDIVKQLIEKGTDINQTIMPEEISPLYYTVTKIGETSMNPSVLLNHIHYLNDSEILQLVNSMPPSLPFLNNAIIDQEKIEAFKKLLKYLGTPKNRELGDNVSQLFIERTRAHIKKYYEIFELLLNAHPNLELRAKGNLNTVLMLATELNEVELVKKLLDAGADKDATIDDIYNPTIKHTAKAFAIQNKNEELVSLL